MSLLFVRLSRWVITFLLRSKNLLISWLQSPAAVSLEPPQTRILQLLVYYKKYKSGTAKCKRSIGQSLEFEGTELSSSTTPQHINIHQPRISPNLIYNSMSSPPTLSRGQRDSWKFPSLQSSDCLVTSPNPEVIEGFNHELIPTA